MKERRKTERLIAPFPVKCWIMDSNNNQVLPDCIPACCLNVSEGGMVLEWPQWWKCKGCPYWNEMSGGGCARRTCPFEDTDRFLVSEAMLRVCIEERNAEHVARIVWVREKESSCHVGIAFAS